MATFGNTVAQTGTNKWINVGANYLFAEPFLCADAGLPTSITVLICDSAVGGKYKCAIYEDNFGLPAALVGYTEEKTGLSFSSNGTVWTTFNVTTLSASDTRLRAGRTYWLVIWSDDSTFYIRATETLPAGVLATKYKASTYGSWAATFPTSLGNVNQEMCIYCTYTVQVEDTVPATDSSLLFDFGQDPLTPRPDWTAGGTFRLVDLFEAGWTMAYGDLTHDARNFLCSARESRTPLQERGMLATPTGNSPSVSRAFSAGAYLDLSDGLGGTYPAPACHWILDYYLAPASGWQSLDQFHFHLVDVNNVTLYYTFGLGEDYSAATIYNDCYSYPTGTYNGNAANQYQCHPGWNTAEFIPRATSFGDAAAFDWSQIKQIKIDWAGTSGSSYARIPVTFGRLAFFNRPTLPGAVVVLFDGDTASQLIAANYLAAAGLPCTMYVWPVGHNSTIADLLAAQTAGVLIGNYCKPNDYWQFSSTSEKKWRLQKNVGWMTAQGFTTGQRIVSKAGGGETTDDIDVILKEGWANSLSGYVGGYKTFWDVRRLPYTVGPSVYTDRKAYVDIAIADHAICVFTFHALTGSAGQYPELGTLPNPASGTFYELADYLIAKVNAGLLRVMTPLDLLTLNARSGGGMLIID